FQLVRNCFHLRASRLLAERIRPQFIGKSVVGPCAKRLSPLLFVGAERKLPGQKVLRKTRVPVQSRRVLHGDSQQSGYRRTLGDSLIKTATTRALKPRFIKKSLGKKL